MNHRSSLTISVAALWFATMAGPQPSLAQSLKPLEPLKAASGRFEIIAGGDAVKSVAAAPQPLPRAPAKPSAERSASVLPVAPPPLQAAPPSLPAAVGPEHAEVVRVLPEAPAPDQAAPSPAAAPVAPPPDAPGPLAALLPPDPIITGAVPAQPSLPQAVAPTIGENMRIAIAGETLMAEALRRARASLQDFLTLAAAPTDGTSGFAVKVLVGPKEAREALWVSALERRVQRNLLFGTTERWSGRLANAPTESSILRVGDRITFETSEIRDWTYQTARGQPLGNFTACALMAAEGRGKLAELTEKTGLDCGWIALTAKTASR